MLYTNKKTLIKCPLKIWFTFVCPSIIITLERRLMHTTKWLIKLVVTFFGLGYSPKAPGTVGSLGALTLWAGLSFMFHTPWILPVCITFCLALSLLCIPYYLHTSAEKDPQKIVIDEAVGVFTMLMLIPLSPPYIGLGFILFRVLDIWKPWPISWIDQFGGTTPKNTISIIGDDILAGLLAGALTQCAFFLLQKTSVSF